MTLLTDCFDYAFYLPSFAGGGAERNCVLLANELCRRGLRVCFFVDRAEGPNRALLAEGVVVDELGGGHASSVVRLRRALLNRKPSVMYAQIGLSPLKYLMASLLVGRRITSVVVYHGIYDPSWRPGGKLNYWFAPVISRAFDSVVAVSHSLREHIVSRFRASAGSVSVIHNPVDLEMLDRLSDEPCDESGFPRPYLVSAGRLVPQKDFSTLVRSFSLVAERVPHDLLILGDGPLRDCLVEEVRQMGLVDRVRFLGYVENPYPIFRRADALVLSSVHEAFGNVLVEALALGLRVVSTDCPGGPREILGGGEWGVLCKPGSPQDLADAMLKALDSPIDAKRCKLRAMNFSVSRIADEYVAIARKRRPAARAS